MNGLIFISEMESTFSSGITGDTEEVQAHLPLPYKFL